MFINSWFLFVEFLSIRFDLSKRDKGVSLLNVCRDKIIYRNTGKSIHSVCTSMGLEKKVIERTVSRRWSYKSIILS